MIQDNNSPDNTTERVTDLITDIFFNGGKLFAAGNGGSMADALHISGELLKSFRIQRKGSTIPQFELQPGVPVWVLGITLHFLPLYETTLKQRIWNLHRNSLQQEPKKMHF